MSLILGNCDKERGRGRERKRKRERKNELRVESVIERKRENLSR